MKITTKITLIGIVLTMGIFLAVKIWQMDPGKSDSGHDPHSEHEGHMEQGDHEEETEHGEHEKHSDHEDRHGEHNGHPDKEESLHLSEDALKASGIEFSAAGPAKLSNYLTIHGIVTPNQDKIARVSPRFSGIVKGLFKKLGDAVQRGDTLAVVESNESLAPYPLLAHISGVIIEKNTALGEFVENQSHLYTIADLSTVWIEFNVHRDDISKLQTGQKIAIHLNDNTPPQTGILNYLSPVGNEGTQSIVARASVHNPDSKWALGLYVYGKAAVNEFEVALAVKREALQLIKGQKTLFVKEGDGIALRPVETGKEDGSYIEILKGISAGELSATKNSFILKAEYGKSEASHDH